MDVKWILIVLTTSIAKRDVDSTSIEDTANDTLPARTQLLDSSVLKARLNVKRKVKKPELRRYKSEGGVVPFPDKNGGLGPPKTAPDSKLENTSKSERHPGSDLKSRINYLGDLTGNKIFNKRIPDPPTKETSLPTDGQQNKYNRKDSLDRPVTKEILPAKSPRPERVLTTLTSQNDTATIQLTRAPDGDLSIEALNTIPQDGTPLDTPTSLDDDLNSISVEQGIFGSVRRRRSRRRIQMGDNSIIPDKDHLPQKIGISDEPNIQCNFKTNLENSSVPGPPYFDNNKEHPVLNRTSSLNNNAPPQSSGKQRPKVSPKPMLPKEKVNKPSSDNQSILMNNRSKISIPKSYSLNPLSVNNDGRIQDFKEDLNKNNSGATPIKPPRLKRQAQPSGDETPPDFLRGLKKKENLKTKLSLNDESISKIPLDSLPREAIPNPLSQPMKLQENETIPENPSTGSSTTEGANTTDLDEGQTDGTLDSSVLKNNSETTGGITTLEKVEENSIVQSPTGFGNLKKYWEQNSDKTSKLNKNH